MDPAAPPLPSASGAIPPTTSPVIVSAIAPAGGGATELTGPSPTATVTASATATTTAATSTAATAALIVANTGGSSEHPLPRRRSAKASISAKREGSGSGAGSGPPGFAVDRSVVTSSSGPIGALSGSPPVSSLAAMPSGFRERTGMRPGLKGDGQGDYSMLAPHIPGAPPGPKLGRPPFSSSNSGMIGDIRPLGRRPEVTLARRHDSSPSGLQKHTPEDMRIQQARRAAWTRASSMGATGNYKDFDSPFGNYLVPVIPNHLFNKTPPAVASPLASPFGLNTGAGRG